MDSRIDTFEHIQVVQRHLNGVLNELLRRMMLHDQSKLFSPEVEVFDEFTPLLKDSEYGSEEYDGFLKSMRVALDHHYRHNRHHPQFHHNGIEGMNLIDLIEMLADWKSSTLRHSKGNIRTSIEINQSRFGYGDELKQILLNTLEVWE